MIKVGIIGAGSIAEAHVSALKHIKGVEIASIADIVPSKSGALASRCGAKTFTSTSELLRSGVDAIWICTPPFLHHEDAIEAAERHIHVFCEKPIALVLEDADKMISSAHRYGVNLMVGQVLRYYPVFKRFKQAYDMGTLGKLVSCWSIRVGYYSGEEGPAWRFDASRGGGMTIEWGVHELDFLRWIGGEVSEVYAAVSYRPGTAAFDEDAWATMKFRDGGKGGIHLSLSSTLAINSRGIIGSEGAVEGDGWSTKVRIAVKGTKEMTEEVEEIVDSSTGVNKGILQEDSSFIDSIKGSTSPPVTGEDGRAALELAHAMLKASKANKVIHIPIDD
jgi:UDP-N-acetylglucosamine 3-dehydrogenase